MYEVVLSFVKVYPIDFVADRQNERLNLVVLDCLIKTES